jgi:hypothetical protein
MYIVLNAQASRLLKIELQNGGGTKRWWKKYFKHGSLLNNIMVIPYLDKNHWSLYILEEGCIVHCDFILVTTITNCPRNMLEMCALHGPFPRV